MSDSKLTLIFFGQLFYYSIYSMAINYIVCILPHLKWVLLCRVVYIIWMGCVTVADAIEPYMRHNNTDD